MRRTIRWLAMPALAAPALACGRQLEVALPQDAEEFTPPPIYARWWAQTEACSGRADARTRIRWYVVPGAETFREGGREVSAAYDGFNRRIVLAGEEQLSGPVVRHEMLHALLHGTKGHPRDAFVERCGGIVSCRGGCLSDVRRQAPASGGEANAPAVRSSRRPASPGSAGSAD